MRLVILALITLLAFVQAVLAKIYLPSGEYRFYYGNFQVPRTHRFATAEPDDRTGKVRTFPLDINSKFQIWKVKHHGNNVVTIESKGCRGKYLSPGRSGALPGAYIGVTTTKQRFKVTRVAGGPFTSYELAYPRKVFHKTLVVSYDYKNKEEPYYLNFVNRGTEGQLDGWKFSRVKQTSGP
ncbi:hypothetical protein BGZ91_001916 [Linnemannia elongata]|nr:hypothetical protein BGZ91_001916 [Linnemannia elongata]KAG0077357.1 hypothetical protein BGZ90_007312 [Linnemannia elongata]